MAADVPNVATCSTECWNKGTAVMLAQRMVLDFIIPIICCTSLEIRVQGLIFYELLLRIVRFLFHYLFL